LILAAVGFGAPANAQSLPSSAGNAVPITVDNFIRAETDRTFDGLVKQGAFATFEHFRELTPLDKQVVPRGNRDTLYSVAVFDLDAGPVTITLPEVGERFMTMMAVDEDHYVYSVVYGAGSYTFTKEEVGTRYLLTAIRTIVDPNSPKDIEQVHVLQDAVKVSQASAGTFEVPSWDPTSQKKVRDALIALNDTLPDLKHAFGKRSEVDPVRHLIATASAWGGNPDKDAVYLSVTPTHNDGNTIYKLNVRDVPVDGFWSVTIYNSQGYLEPNKLSVYSFNNITAKKESDGSITIQFGGCDGKIPNCLPSVPGWNYMVRLYRPRPEILNGTWKFPEARPVG
jgi:hypothetical protein